VACGNVKLLSYCLLFQEKWFVLNGNYLMQYSSDEEAQSPQSQMFLKNHAVKELTTPDSNNDDSHKFMFAISPVAGESWYTSVIFETVFLLFIFYFIYCHINSIT